MEVVVVNNATDYQPIHWLDNLRTTLDLHLTLLHEPRSGIPYARNAALSHAVPVSDWIAFVDDDEWVDPYWLTNLLQTCRSHNTHAAAGPVLPQYSVTPPNWVAEANARDRPRRATGTRLDEAHTNNLLLSTDLLATVQPWFLTNLPHVGGTDTELTRRITAQGYSIVWCDQAFVYEDVPLHRLTIQWHLRRNYRKGGNRIDRALATTPLSRKLFMIGMYLTGAIGEAVLCAFGSIYYSVFHPSKSVVFLFRIVRSVGTWGRILHLEVREYKP